MISSVVAVYLIVCFIIYQISEEDWHLQTGTRVNRKSIESSLSQPEAPKQPDLDIDVNLFDLGFGLWSEAASDIEAGIKVNALHEDSASKGSLPGFGSGTGSAVVTSCTTTSSLEPVILCSMDPQLKKTITHLCLIMTTKQPDVNAAISWSLVFEPRVEQDFLEYQSVSQAHGIGGVGVILLILGISRMLIYWMKTLGFADASSVPCFLELSVCKDNFSCILVINLAFCALGGLLMQVWSSPQPRLLKDGYTVRTVANGLSIVVWILAVVGNLSISRLATNEVYAAFCQGVASMLVPLGCVTLLRTPFWLCGAIWFSIMAVWLETDTNPVTVLTMSGICFVAVLLLLYALEYSQRKHYLIWRQAKQFAQAQLAAYEAQSKQFHSC